MSKSSYGSRFPRPTARDTVAKPTQSESSAPDQTKSSNPKPKFQVLHRDAKVVRRVKYRAKIYPIGVPRTAVVIPTTEFVEVDDTPYLRSQVKLGYLERG